MKLGTNIKNRREEMKLTQKDLASGICTQSQISKIEKGESVPLADLLYRIADKLNISIDELYDNNKKKFKLDIEKYNKLLNCYDYISIEKELFKIDKDLLGYEDKIYIEYLENILDSELHSKNTVNNLKKLLDINMDLINDELKVNIMNSLGVLLMDQKQNTEAAKYLEKAYSIIFIKQMDEKLSAKVLYNYLRLLLFKQNLKELYKESNEAINFSFRTGIYSYVSEYIYFKHLSLELLGCYNLADEEELIFAKYIAKNQKKFKILNKLMEINKLN